ncbi:hypothetical protein ACQUSR_29835 [Streptomyces sp. P1-3]|uniref:hypothetical protein n=1 Tax=Streptomyces sp. P1-3 TaxID=3421658 RepID=UPI003D36ED8A
MTAVVEPQTMARLAYAPCTTKFQLQGKATGTQIPFKFDTIDGNRPKSNANTVFLWQTSDLRIPSTAPLFSMPVKKDEPKGSDVFQPVSLERKPYLMGYGVGPEVKNICSLLLFNEQGEEQKHFFADLSIKEVGTDSVTFKYFMPAGTKGVTDRDWFGLWETDSPADLYSSRPVATGYPSGNLHEGDGALFHGLIRDRKYTIGYFKGGYQDGNPKQTTLACTETFTA